MTSRAPTSTVPPPASPPSASESSAGGSIAAAVVALLLLDLAVETFLAGSPILWTVMGVEVLAIAGLSLLWSRLGPTARLAIPLLALLGIVAWASLRLGTGAEPGLRLASLTLPRIGVGLAILGTLAAVVLMFGLARVRRAWPIGMIVALLALYALVPLGTRGDGRHSAGPGTRRRLRLATLARVVAGGVPRDTSGAADRPAGRTRRRHRFVQPRTPARPGPSRVC